MVRTLSWISRYDETEKDLLQMHNLLMQGRAQTDDLRHLHFGNLVLGISLSNHVTPLTE
jgi:hypothetical protein